MRIAQIMLGKGFGGAERSFVDICAALSKRGHDVLAICEHRAQAMQHIAAIEGVEVRSTKVRGPWDYFACRAIRSLLHEFRPSIVQAHLARAAALGGSAARDLDIPTVAKMHNYVKLKYYKSIDHLVPTTSKQQAYLIDNGVPSGDISDIPNFSSIPTSPNAIDSYDTNLDVIAIGRLVHKKGFDILLEAVAEIHQSGIGIRLSIAGDGPEMCALRERVRVLQISNIVSFLGWQSSVQDCLTRANVFVLPSRDEPFGIVVLEAMALNVPVIATRTDGPLEMLDDDIALLIDREDMRGLVAALENVAQDYSAAWARADAARQRFNERYSEAVVVASYEALYGALIEQHATRK
ncbi:MAG: glycosyltransferase [Gammaproteobacteria bacterium]